MNRKTGLRLKRLIDVTASCMLLLVLSPVMIITAIMVRYHFGSPIIFKSARISQFAGVFYAYKFRSMRDLFDASGKPLPDEARLTRFSKILRATSLDELPQLWNVIKGEMSLIGPRAIITDFLPYLDERERKRLEMPPGITGLAQVNGRNSLEWDKRLEMDVWYVENWSLWLDIKIALKTIPVWLGAQGVSTPGFATFQRLDDVRKPFEPAAPTSSESKLQDA